jgi:site-specific DNA recombinase
MKRVYCLYRVSTKQQVDKHKDDIPMQKLACHNFAQQNGWLIMKEFYEKGVSGFKVSANDRDAIQELREAAVNQEFDVLLVYMFDRLGRRDDETPFVVEWFANQGIEIWSVQEGQQKFENHTDKLLNYIRYWQANGESIKTSMRLKTRMAQLTMEGVYHGGVAPLGYRAVYKGRVNRKGQPVRDLEIVPEEAEYVKMIFDKTVNEGYGSHRMAEYLNQLGIKTHNGAKFQANSVNRILKNRLYCGYYVSKDAVSPKQDNLAIIDEDIFEQVQKILKFRRDRQEGKMVIADATKEKVLLYENIYCAHCGCHLVATEGSDKYICKDGTKRDRRYLRYICYHSSRKLNDCDGQTIYSALKVDTMVLDIVGRYLHKIVGDNKDEVVERKYKQEIKKATKTYKKLMGKKEKYQKQLNELFLEVGKCVSGESEFTVDVISSSIDTARTELDAIDERLSSYEELLNNKHKLLDKLRDNCSQVMKWKEEFDKDTFEQRKDIVNQLIKTVKIGRGYNIEIEFHENYKPFIMD